MSIRSSAATLVEDLADQVNDYQIIFCAAAKGIIQESKPTLEDLNDHDLDALYMWLVHQESQYKRNPLDVFG